MAISLFAAALVASTSGAHSEPLRTWTALSGKRVEARMRSHDGKVVILETIGGGTVQIPIQRLISIDRRYIAQSSPTSNDAAHANSPSQTAGGGMGFKGLKLGMSRSAVRALTESSPWEFDQMGRSTPESDCVYLTLPFMVDNSFSTIGPGGPAWTSAHVYYYQDTVYKLVVEGNDQPIESLPGVVKTWVIPAVKILEEQFGKPAGAEPPGADVMAAKARAGLNRYAFHQFLEWNPDSDRVVALCVSRERIDNTCTPQFYFLDKAQEKARRSRRR